MFSAIFRSVAVLLIPVALLFADSLAAGNHLGCYLRDRPFEYESGSGANGNNANPINVNNGIPLIPNSASNDVSANKDAMDLWFSPGESSTVFNVNKCIKSCRGYSFRFAGIFIGASKLECLCGSSYGRNGEGRCDRCSSDDSLYCGSDNSASIYDTGFKVPSPPQQIMLLHRTEKTLKISWVKPIAPNGPLTGYNVTAKGIFSYALSPSTLQLRSWKSAEADEEMTITGLTPGSLYSITVSAINSEGESLPATATMWTKLGVPDPPPSPKIIRQDATTMMILIRSGRNTKGPVSAYRVAMIDGARKSFFNKDKPAIWNDTVRVGYPHYIAAEFSPDDIPPNGLTFVVGDGKKYRSYYNGPLPEGHWHPALVVVSSMDDYTEISYSTSSHLQHADIDQTSPDKKEKVNELHRRDEDLIEIIGPDSGVLIALWVSIGVGVGILLICVAAYAVLKLNLIPKRRRPHSRPPSRQFENHQLATRESSAFSLAHDNELCYSHGGYVNDEDLKNICLEKLKQVWNVPRNFMDIPADDEESVELLGRGRYGPVYLSSLKTNGDPVTQYIIPDSTFKSKDGKKTTLEGNDELIAHLDELIRIQPQHVNLVKLIGFMEDGDSILFAVEFGGVSLKSWLLNYRQFDEEAKANPISAYSLLFCAMNIAEAIFHLHSFKITHGQLAACNVLITDIEVPKVTGFGLLSCNPLDEEKDYTRWNSAEQFHNRCVKPCDIWAFGVLLWEIATLGGTPYHDIHNEDLQKRVARGSRPTQVEVIGDSLYQIMLNCWQIDRDERPDFGKLSCSIYELLPQSVENLFISSSFNYPPYIHNNEHIK